MRLTQKYRLYTLTTLIWVVLTSFCIQYYLFRYSIHRTTDDVLHEYRIDIEEYAAEMDTLLPFRSLELKHSNLTVETDIQQLADIDETICDTLIFSHYENEMVVYRKMKFPVCTSHQNYIVTVMLPTLEEHDLVGTVLISLVLFVLLFVLFSTITDWFFAQKISGPFRKILDHIRTYDIEHPSFVPLNHYGIDEFQELNHILQVMMTKINQDYTHMKEFLEDTSHELQTPLSIIRLKLENLLQSDIPDPEALNNLLSIHQAVNRMICFNRALLFLAKINNDQFAPTGSINLNHSFQQFLSIYQELFDARHIQLKLTADDSFYVHMHPLLAEHLMQNLLTNAVKHNDDGGEILLHFQAHSLSIYNTFHGKLPEGNLFERYRIHSDPMNSNGLGLTIVKKICDKSKLHIHYRLEGKYFILCICHPEYPCTQSDCARHR